MQRYARIAYYAKSKPWWKLTPLQKNYLQNGWIILLHRWWGYIILLSVLFFIVSKCFG